MSFSVSVVTTVVLSLTFTPIRRSLLLACSWLLRCVALESLCVADRLILINWESTMLRGQDVCHFYISQKKSFKLYFDPELADNHSTYGDFLTRLHAAGMFRFWGIPYHLWCSWHRLCPQDG